jgi:hypothetical protein
MSSTKLNISKLELIHKHEWLESVVQHLKAIYCKKLKKGKAKMRMTFDFRGNELDVSKTCSETESSLPQRLRLLYEKFRNENKDDVEKMKEDFYQNNGLPPLFQTDQQILNSLKRQHGLLEEEVEKTKKKVKFMEMSARNLQNQTSIRAKRSTDPKQARQRFVDACKECDKILSSCGEEAREMYCSKVLHGEEEDVRIRIAENVRETIQHLRKSSSSWIAQEEYSILLAALVDKDVVDPKRRNGYGRKLSRYLQLSNRNVLSNAAKRRQAFFKQRLKDDEFAVGDKVICSHGSRDVHGEIRTIEKNVQDVDDDDAVVPQQRVVVLASFRGENHEVVTKKLVFNSVKGGRLRHEFVSLAHKRKRFVRTLTEEKIITAKEFWFNATIPSPNKRDVKKTKLTGKLSIEYQCRFQGKPVRKIYQEYQKKYGDEALSLGMFVTLKPSYIKPLKRNECICKKCRIFNLALETLNTLEVLLERQIEIMKEKQDLESDLLRSLDILVHLSRQKTMATFFGESRCGSYPSRYSTPCRDSSCETCGGTDHIKYNQSCVSGKCTQCDTFSKHWTVVKRAIRENDEMIVKAEWVQAVTWRTYDVFPDNQFNKREMECGKFGTLIDFMDHMKSIESESFSHKVDVLIAEMSEREYLRYCLQDALEVQVDFAKNGTIRQFNWTQSEFFGGDLQITVFTCVCKWLDPTCFKSASGVLRQNDEVSIVNSDLRVVSHGTVMSRIDGTNSYYVKLSCNDKEVQVERAKLRHRVWKTCSIVILSDEGKHKTTEANYYIRRVLEEIEGKVPQCLYLRLKSDNCGNQFKNRKALSYLSTLQSTERFKGRFLRFVRDFGGPGHGKSSVDGLGAAIKRLINTLILGLGKDAAQVKNADECVTLLQEHYEADTYNQNPPIILLAHPKRCKTSSLRVRDNFAFKLARDAYVTQLDAGKNSEDIDTDDFIAVDGIQSHFQFLINDICVVQLRRHACYCDACFYVLSRAGYLDCSTCPQNMHVLTSDDPQFTPCCRNTMVRVPNSNDKYELDSNYEWSGDLLVGLNKSQLVTVSNQRCLNICERLRLGAWVAIQMDSRWYPNLSFAIVKVTDGRDWEDATHTATSTKPWVLYDSKSKANGQLASTKYHFLPRGGHYAIAGKLYLPSKGDESVFTLDDDKSTDGGNFVVVTSNVLLVDFEMKLCADKVSWKLPQKTRAEIMRYCVVPFTNP